MQLIQSVQIYEECRDFMNSDQIGKLGPQDIQNIEVLMQNLSQGLHQQYGEGPLSKKARSKKKTYGPLSDENVRRTKRVQNWLLDTRSRPDEELTSVEGPDLHLTPPTESWLANAPSASLAATA